MGGQVRPDVNAVYSFTGKDGELPYAGLVEVGSTLYGTATGGGGNRKGAVFSITPGGTVTLLHGFTGTPDGAEPYAGLTPVRGTLYGTTMAGGTVGNGIVFKITTTGSEKVLYSFKGGADGGNPSGRLTLLDGVLYGTTESGGAHGYGSVFRVTRSGEESVLYSFKGGSDGAVPEGELIAVGGLLYGTTYGAGSDHGTAFSVTTSGQEAVLHNFAGAPSDGANPSAGLVNVRGTLYGTTTTGGSGCGSGSGGCGTVYKITTSGAETVLHSFQGSYSGSYFDGAYPYAKLTNVNGTLYGTTAYGYRGCYSGFGCGALFKITTSGSETVVSAFGGGRGAGSAPHGQMIKIGHLLYGTAYRGGVRNVGTVFTYQL